MHGVEGEVEKKGLVRTLLGLDEGRRLVAEGVGEVARFLKRFAVAEDRRGILPFRLVGRQIDVATPQETKEPLEAAIERSQAGRLAEVPLPDHAGDVTGRFEPLEAGSPPRLATVGTGPRSRRAAGTCPLNKAARVGVQNEPLA